MTKRAFLPHFLKYPNDIKKIQEILLKYRKSHPAPFLVEAPAAGIKHDIRVATAVDAGGGTLLLDPVTAKGQLPARSPKIPASGQRTKSQAAPVGVASAAVELFLDQAGHLSLGAHCTLDIEGVVHCINQQPVGWFDFEFAPSSSGPWTKAAFIGNSGDPDNLGNIPFVITIDADLYASNYSAGSKWFRLVFNEMNVHWGNSIVTMPMWSDPVLLDFSTKPACNSIHAVRFLIAGLDVGADCTLTGSKNGQEPTFVVVLSQPALADQKIMISTDNRNLGWISTNTSGNTLDMTIPAGQQSGAISWFLGTKKVITTGRQFHVVATLVQPDGSHGNYGLGKVSLTKP